MGELNVGAFTLPRFVGKSSGTVLAINLNGPADKLRQLISQD